MDVMDFRASVNSLAAGEPLPVVLRVVDGVDPVGDPETFSNLTPMESNHNTWRWRRYHQPYDRDALRVVGVYLAADELGEWKRSITRYDLLKDAMVGGGLLRRLVDAADVGRVVGARLIATDHAEMVVVANAIRNGDPIPKLTQRWIVMACLFRAVAGLLEDVSSGKRGPGTLPADDDEAKARIKTAIKKYESANGREQRKSRRRNLKIQAQRWPDLFRQVAQDLYQELTRGN